MANRNFNKQVVPARKKLAIGGPAGGKDDPRRNLGPRIKDMMKRPKDLKKSPERPGQPLPLKPKDPRDMLPKRPMPKLPRTPRPTPLTPKQQKKLRDLMDKKRGRGRKNKRKQLMGGGSSSSREAMMHGFYNKDMGMGKKKK